MVFIEFNERDYGRIIRALRTLPFVVAKANDVMQKTCALEYKQLVAFNIMTQKHSFRAHSKNYREWKQKHFPEYPAFWRLYGDVLRNLSAFEHEGGWMGGIPKGRVGQGGRVVAYYATRVEEGWTAKGGGKRPARRMFWKTKEDYRKNPAGWQKQSDIAHNKIGAAWR